MRHRVKKNLHAFSLDAGTGARHPVPVMAKRRVRWTQLNPQYPEPTLAVLVSFRAIQVNKNVYCLATALHYNIQARAVSRENARRALLEKLRVYFLIAATTVATRLNLLHYAPDIEWHMDRRERYSLGFFLRRYKKKILRYGGIGRVRRLIVTQWEEERHLREEARRG